MELNQTPTSTILSFNKDYYNEFKINLPMNILENFFIIVFPCI